MWTGDNLPILRGLNSESVDLIYLDPPFNSKTDYAAPIGSRAAGAAFKDTWALSDVDVEWANLIEEKHPALYRVLLAAMTSSDKSYLIYMASRLLEIGRILKPTGSIYLHCDPTMSHTSNLSWTRCSDGGTSGTKLCGATSIGLAGRSIFSACTTLSSCSPVQKDRDFTRF